MNKTTAHQKMRTDRLRVQQNDIGVVKKALVTVLVVPQIVPHSPIEEQCTVAQVNEQYTSLQLPAEIASRGSDDL